MKLQIERNDLLTALGKVLGVTTSKAVHILGCVKIDTHMSGVRIDGTDLDVSIHTEARAEIQEKGCVCVNAKLLSDTVKSLPSGPISISADGKGWMHLSAGTAKIKLATDPAADFPNVPEVVTECTVVLPGDLMAYLIGKTYHSLSADTSRVVFTGALFSADHLVARMVTTDGHRLSKVEVPCTGSLEPVVIPRKALAELRRNLGSDVGITVQKEMINLHISGPGEAVSITARLVPGRFPNFAKVIPTTHTHSAALNRAELMTAAKRAQIYSPHTGCVTVTISAEGLGIHATVEQGDLVDSVACVYEGPGSARVGIHHGYLLDALSAIDGQDIIMRVIDCEAPIILCDPAVDDVHVIMPMQV